MCVFETVKKNGVYVAVALASVAAPSFAAEGGQVGSYFSAIDLAGVAEAVGAAGVTIVGITMAYKGISLAKRAVNKA